MKQSGAYLLRRWSGSLLYRILAINALLFVVAVGVLVLTPFQVHAHTTSGELLVLLLGVGVLLLADFVLVARTLVPLRHLVEVTKRAHLHGFERGRLVGPGASYEIIALSEVLGDMLERLDAERVNEEAERRRAALALHDDLGRSLGEMARLAERASAADGVAGEEIREITVLAKRGLTDLRRLQDEFSPPAPADTAPRAPIGADASADTAEAGSRGRRRRIVMLALVLVVAGVSLVVFGHPAALWRRVREGNAGWLALSIAWEAASIGGYIVAFRVLVADGVPRLGWRMSAAITLAGIVATKVIAAFGAGGIALNVWALRVAGLSGRKIGERMAALLFTLYTVFVTLLLVFALGQYAGIFSGPAPPELTLLPALIAMTIVGLIAGMTRAPARMTGVLARFASARAPFGTLANAAIAALDTARGGATRAFAVARERPLGALGALAYWGLDIMALWAALHAFGSPPAFGGVVVSYFVAQLLGALPVPGGIGVVEGGLVGTLIAFGSSGSLALVGVIAYRFISEWLPAGPGGLAYAWLIRNAERERETPAAR